jgi:hypothetical protein
MRGQALDLVGVEDGIAFQEGDFALDVRAVVRLFRLREFAGEDDGGAVLALLDERGAWPLYALAQDFRARREHPHGEFLPLLDRGADDPPDHRGDGYGEAFLSGKSLASGIGLYSRSIRHTLSPPFFRALFSFMRKWASR